MEAPGLHTWMSRITAIDDALECATNAQISNTLNKLEDGTK